MATITITGGAFQDFTGTVIASGYLTLQLSHDEQSTTPSQVASGPVIKINLDSSGNIVTNTKVWPNDQLLPAGSYYVVNCYKADGTFVWGPQYWNLTGAGPINVATIIPVYPVGTGGNVSVTVNFSDGEVPTGSINGSNTSFTLAHSPNPAGSLILMSDDLVLQSTVGYTLSGTSLTLTTAPVRALVAWYRF